MRLSVIVPDVGSEQALEDTLVSVLQNRPGATEVIVVCGPDRLDRYNLAGEVIFHRTAAPRRWPNYANAAVQQAAGHYIQLLLPGAEVVEGWCEAALARFEHSQRIGSVAPLLLLPDSQDGLAVAGLQYNPGGRRELCVTQLPPADDGAALLRVDGPTCWSGFYRKPDLIEAGGWDTNIFSHLADMELALRLRQRGLRGVCELSSWIALPANVSWNEPTGYRFAGDVERLFWRYAMTQGWIRSMAMHPFEVLSRFAGSLPSLTAVTELAGRLAALLPRPAVPRSELIVPTSATTPQRRAA